MSFDLDFTLINNKQGIINSFNFALKKFKLPKLPEIKIEKMIGIPLEEMFGRISDLNPTKLAGAFRVYYGEKGIYQSYLLPGIKEKLEELRANKFTLGIITSKKQEMAAKILKFLEISYYFTYILGETEEIKSKADPKIRKYLDKKFPGFTFIVIGDHPKDALLAKNLSCPFIGVLTGSHDEESLRKARENDNITLILKSVKQINAEMINKLINGL